MTDQRAWTCLPEPPSGHPGESILWDAEQVLREIDSLFSEDIKVSSANLLGRLKEELHKAASLVAGTEYSIAFVGDIGVGKSTAICRVAGLQVWDSSRSETTTVLESGQGRVTICEVHLLRGPGYGMRVTPMGRPQVEREVREFASALKEPPASIDEDSGDQAFGTTREIGRAIRNMTGLTTRPSDGRGSKKVDRAKTLAESSASTETFIQEILGRMGLDGRTKHEIWYSSETSNDKDALSWLKDNFSRINNGRHPDFSIPERIEVVLPDPILGDVSSSIRLIDTKGIDQTAERADLESLFSDPFTAVVMCSRFTDIPAQSTHQLLRRVKEGGAIGLEYKGTVLGLARHGEALSMRDDEGNVAESVEEGYELKSDEAQAALQAIGFPDLRVGFFDSMNDSPDDFRDVLLTLIHDIRQHQQSELQAVVDDTRSMIQNFEQEGKLEVMRIAAKHLRTWVDHNRVLDFSSLPEPQSSLFGALRTVHASSVRASVRREGEWYNLDYSDQLSFGARSAADRMIRDKVQGFRAVVDTLRQNESYEEATALLGQARRVINAGAADLGLRCGSLGASIHSSNMQRSPNPNLWALSDEEWGRGPGYRVRVARHHRGWFEAAPDFKENVAELIQVVWSETLETLEEVLTID